MVGFSVFPDSKVLKMAEFSVFPDLQVLITTDDPNSHLFHIFLTVFSYIIFAFFHILGPNSNSSLLNTKDLTTLEPVATAPCPAIHLSLPLAPAINITSPVVSLPVTTASSGG